MSLVTVTGAGRSSMSQNFTLYTTYSVHPHDKYCLHPLKVYFLCNFYASFEKWESGSLNWKMDSVLVLEFNKTYIVQIGNLCLI